MRIQVDLHVGGCFTHDGKQHDCNGNVFVSLESHYQHVIELYKKLWIFWSEFKHIVNLWRTVVIE